MNEEDIEGQEVSQDALSTVHRPTDDEDALRSISNRDSMDQNSTEAKGSVPQLAQLHDDSDVSFIVGIGSSAGGLEALEQFFQNMPMEDGLTFVVIQHMSPHFKSLLNELLARHTQMQIYEIEDGMQLLPNRIYLAPPRQHIVCSGHKLNFVVRSNPKELHMPIDTFFRSMAHEFGRRAIAVILSGTGSDGSHHLGELHQAGGFIVAQDEASAGFDGMPRSAIATGHVQVVSPPQEIPRKIVERIRKVGVPQEFSPLGKVAIDEDSISVLFAILKQHFPVDFNMYKQAPMTRCVQRRLSLHNIEDISQYIQLIQTDTDERDLLVRELLIDVTAFFRDEDAFALLRKSVLPQILQNDSADNRVRLWVAGCATGEEVYSLAMLVLEWMWSEGVNVDVRIFATDVHEQSLEIASMGFYPAYKVADIPEEWLRRYFIAVQDGYRVTKQLRDMVVFAPHNLIQDPPFTKIDLICCRNLLIYLNAAAQKKVLANIHFGLHRGGFLMLGPSEQIQGMEESFEYVDRYWRIYRKIWSETEREILPFSQVEQLSAAHLRQTPSVPIARGGESELYITLLEKYMPTGLLLNENYELLHIFGNASEYLKPMMGQATLNVLRLVSNDLHIALRAGLYHASRQDSSVVYRDIRAETSQGMRKLTITVEPLRDRVRGLQRYLIIFDAATSAALTQKAAEPNEQVFDVKDESLEHIHMLERELQYTKHYLQTTIEELEATNEELQSTNEELVVSNEELQSTNEELHSVNEELYTVNVEYQQKIEELTQVTNDMRNLQENAKIAMIFLDSNLKIREYTAAAAEIFSLLPQDVKRPIAHLLYNIKLNPETLSDAAHEVLAHATTWEQEVQTGDEKFYLLRILPYLNEMGQVEGVVLTFIDVSQLKRAQMERDKLMLSLQSSEERYRALVESQAELICRYQAKDFKILYANDACRVYFGDVMPEFENYSFLDLVPETYHDELRSCIDEVLQKNQESSIEHQVLTGDGQTRWQEWIVLPVHPKAASGGAVSRRTPNPTDANSDANDDANDVIIQASGRDITERKIQEETIAKLNDQLQKNNEELEERVQERTQALQWVNEQLRRSNEELDNFVYIASHDLKEPLRGIHNYVTLLQDLNGHQLDQGGHDKLNSLQRLSGRLIMQIEDLRLYSRMGRTDANLQPIDLNMLLEQVLEDLEPLLNEQAVDLRIPRALPVVEYSQSRLQAIFQNLIANAAKYNSKDEKWIEIGVCHPGEAEHEAAMAQYPDQSGRELQDSDIFYIRDNGIGIRARHQERIFEMFKRLHPQDAYGGGTGAGLAIVKRILQQNHGTIWLESQENTGTCFWFTLTHAAASNPDEIYHSD